VAKGFSQIPGRDFNETYSSVVTHDTLRLFMSTVAAMDMDIQLDVKTAFLYGHIDEEIYIEQPNGFIIPGREKEVCRLNKCIYGLRRASRVWNEHFSTFLKSEKFSVSNADPCLFIRRRGDETTLVIIWVDDGSIASNKPECTTKFLTNTRKTFQIRSHQPDRFVRITITRERNERRTFLSQPDYIHKMVKTFYMEGCHPKSIPADPNSKLTKPSGNQIAHIKNKIRPTSNSTK
jgi:Reverse transcriptase (RNA-dependent DNA polymerase)